MDIVADYNYTAALRCRVHLRATCSTAVLVTVRSWIECIANLSSSLPSATVVTSADVVQSALGRVLDTLL